MTNEPDSPQSQPAAHPAAPIPLSASHVPQSEVSVLASLERYWRGLCGNGSLPRRADVDPADIDGALPYTFVAETVAPGIARLRVAGRMLNDMTGMDVRGMPLSALFSADARPMLADGITSLMQGPALVDMPVRLPRTMLRRAQAGRLLMLPLLDRDGAVTRILGAIVMDGVAVGRGPLKLDIAESGAVRIEPAPTMARPGSAPMAGRPGLRLVVNNG